MFLSLFLTDRLGRKLLLLVSALGDVVCLCILAWSFDQLGEDSPNLSPIMKYVPMIAMLLFYLFFSVGYGHIPLILLGELFPDNTKALASSIAVAVLWLFDFAVAKLYFLVSNQIGVSGNFYLLSALTFCGFLFVLILVPETKHKTLAEVQEMVKNQKVFLSCDLFQRVKKDDSSV
jgi:MFS family permease